MKRFVLLVWMTLGVLTTVAQTNVEIVGEVVGGAGKRVVLGAYSDMLTQSELVLDSMTVGEDGRFVLKCYANYPRLVFIQMERYSQSFYIEPSRIYNVYIPDFDWDMDEKKNIFLEPVALPIEFLGIDSTELNIRIMKWEEQMAASNYQLLPLPSNANENQDGFFERYVRFKTLEIRLAQHKDSRKKLVRKYVENEPIRYYDENYMRFFLALFEHSISFGTKKVAQWQMADWVSSGHVEGWLDTLGLDPLLENEQIRELAALQALKEMYFMKEYNREDVVKMTQRLGEYTKFSEHRELAERLLAMFGRTEGRASAGLDFSLPDVERNRVSLSSMKGKWVYLAFVRTGDPNCIKEIETMAHFRDSLYSAYPNVEFVSVVCDREFQKMYHFVKNSRRGTRCRWTWLHFDGDYELLERWGVVCYPKFVLLNPEGRKVYNYTPAPGSGFLLHGPWEKAKE